MTMEPNTLVLLSFAGIGLLLLEMLNLRKAIFPAAALAVAGLFIFNLQQWDQNSSLYHNMLVNDNFAVAFNAVLLLIGFFVLALSGPFYRDEQSKISDYLSVIVFALSGAVALTCFGNLAMFFLGVEVLSISLYILAGSRKRLAKSNEAAMKYFLMGSFFSGIMLFGIALIYGETGSFDLNTIRDYAHSNPPGLLFFIGTGMILLSLLFKVAAVPFHFWAPDVYEGSPMLITLFMSTIAKIAVFAAFYRLFDFGLAVTYPTYAWLFTLVTAASLFLGTLSAFVQDSLKRMLAFGGISHAGFMLMAVAAVYANTANSLLYYSLAYGLSSVVAFAVAITVSEQAGSEKLEAFNGLGRRKPLLALAMTISLLSMAGIPPLAGFFGKYFVLYEAARTGHLLLAIFAVITSMISVYYYFRIISAMYLRESREAVIHVHPVYSLVIAAASLLLIASGLFPSLINEMIR